MAITLSQIGEWLKERDLSFEVDEKKSLIFFVFGGEGHREGHYIHVLDNGNIFKWDMHLLDSENGELMIPKEHQSIMPLFLYILQKNYDTTVGTWEYDPKNGYIRLSVEIPLMDVEMTFSMFYYIARYMLVYGHVMAENIHRIVADEDAVIQKRAVIGKEEYEQLKKLPKKDDDENAI